MSFSRNWTSNTNTATEAQQNFVPQYLYPFHIYSSIVFFVTYLFIIQEENYCQVMFYLNYSINISFLLSFR